jgi:hypothetical protein
MCNNALRLKKVENKDSGLRGEKALKSREKRGSREGPASIIITGFFIF